jgi:CubicO group peptidase (beta-lactamase class C family)
MYKLIIIIFLTLSSTVLANQVNTHDELTVTLERIRTQNDVPAMAVAIISAGEVTYIKGFGFLDETKDKPTTQKSLFRTASISKLFTAQAIMQLVENKKLSLSDHVSQYLSVFENTHITIKELLTHSSGLRDSVRPVNVDAQRTEPAYLSLVQKAVVKNAENKTFEYSDTGFNVLGSVISTVSGVSYEKYINDNILIPAGMKKSKYSNGINQHVADAHPTYKGILIDKSEQRPYDLSFNPSEGLVSNVYDLSLWLKLTLANDNAILKAQTYKDMLAPQIKTVWGEIYMGLGWQVYKSEGADVARHSGSIRGYKSLILTYPENKDAMILLTNSSNESRWETAKSITKILKQNTVWQ